MGRVRVSQKVTKATREEGEFPKGHVATIRSRGRGHREGRNPKRPQLVTKGGQNSQKIGHVVYGCPLSVSKIGIQFLTYISYIQ